MEKSNATIEKTTCYHCGEDCKEEHLIVEDKDFCCQGCKMVYEIINQNGMCEYYEREQQPGLNQKFKVREGKFAFLDNADIASKLIHFSEGDVRHVIFYLPQMHCSSCIWLLEHLGKINKAIIHSSVNFLKKEVAIQFRNPGVSLRELAELLTRVGYEPHISLHDLDTSKIKKYDRSRIYKIGIAGFCFGNIMMLSFPEYFSSGDIAEEDLKNFFTYLNLVLSLPVFFYAASEFFISAWKGIRQRFLNIDAPIALAILITFGRSLFEILSGTGAGYLDSMSGIVFFMLVGRFFQDKTYQSLTFDRDYTSYFPIGVTVIDEQKNEKQVPVSELKKGDRIRVHSHEIIPADGILFFGKANIDYSFVTGESLPTEKGIGEIIYSGGKQVGGMIELEIIKEVSQSYLTQLWNNDVFKNKKENRRPSFVHRISRYFTYILFSITALSAIYWSVTDPSKVWSAVTACLIVACPCALLLSATFTNGNMLAKLQGRNFFIRNAGVLEDLSAADTIVFDKTGTLSLQDTQSITFEGSPLNSEEKALARSLASQSNHPLSKAIDQLLSETDRLPVKDFQEEKGRGSRGLVNAIEVKLGSRKFVGETNGEINKEGSRVYLSVAGKVLGYFLIDQKYREGLSDLILDLKKHYKLALLSGDNDSERHHLQTIFGMDADLTFQQSPQDKLNYIKKLQESGRRVIMIGDGLNDAGALQQSDAGIAVTDDINNFSPACDGILDGRYFRKLNQFLAYCKREKNIIYGSFVISILYNFAGLYYAVQGDLSPVIAAILMPLSSISIVTYTTAMSTWHFRKLKT